MIFFLFSYIVFKFFLMILMIFSNFFQTFQDHYMGLE